MLEVEVTLRLGLRTVSFSVATAARVLGVVGPSGVGKSTFLRVLAGLERRAEGTVEVLGERWQGAGVFVPPWRRGVGWVPQDAVLFPHLTVRENLGYAGASEEKIAEMAAFLGVEPLLVRAPRHLSGGERQRVALGRALLGGPRLLLLDEPFAALDRRLRERLRGDLAERCRREALPVVLATHDEADIEAFGGELRVLE